MKSLLALLLLLAAAPAGAQRVPVEGRPGAVLEGRGGRAVLRLPGGAVPLGVGLPPCEPCAPRSARLVGERPGAALVLLLTLASRPGTPGGMCGAGEEEVLSVVRLRPRPREAAAVLLSSCWHNVESGGAPSWDGRRGLLEARRWTPESGDAPERLAWRIGADGRVVTAGSAAATRAAPAPPRP